MFPAVIQGPWKPCAAIVCASLPASAGVHAAPAAAANLPTCAVGMHVTRVSPLNYGAVILKFDAAKGTYQVKSDSDGLLDWVPASKLRSSCVGAEAASVTMNYFIGKWSLFVGPTAHHQVIDDKGYLVVGPGAHVPPLQVNADGSYVWVIDSKTTLKGQWRTLADKELRAGTKPPAILLMKAEGGKDWEVWKTGTNAGNNRDAISVERMDLGQSVQGTRLP